MAQPVDSPSFMPADFMLVANADDGDPILMPNPLPTGMSDVHLVTVDPTPDLVTHLRDKLVGDLARDRAILQDNQNAYKDAQARLVQLNLLQTLLLISTNSVGSVSVDARSAYRVMYGADSPTPRPLPGDTTMFLDPLRADADRPTCGAVNPNESSALTFADLERVNADIRGTQSDIQKWPGLISQLQSQIQQAQTVLDSLNDWLLFNTPIE